jgi:hypothetical protein
MNFNHTTRFLRCLSTIPKTNRLIGRRGAELNLKMERTTTEQTGEMTKIEFIFPTSGVFIRKEFKARKHQKWNSTWISREEGEARLV